MRKITTPYYFYNGDQFEKNCKSLSKVADENNAIVVMALKSSTLKNTIKIAEDNLQGFEISNINEANHLDRNLIKNKLLFISSPVLDEDEYIKIKQLNSRSTIIHFDSLEQLNLIKNESFSETHVGLRIALDTRGVYSEKDSDAITTRFGLPFEQIDSAVKTINFQKLSFHSLQIHHFMKSNSIQSFLNAAKELKEIVEKYKLDVRYIDFGGGLKGVGLAGFSELCKELRKIIPKDIKMVFEPGNLLSEGCIHAAGTVKNIKKIRETYVVNTDLSKECHLKWSEPLLQWPPNPGAAFQHKVAIFGPTCFEGDLIGQFRLASENEHLPISLGETLIFQNIDTYSQAWNTSFNGVSKSRIYFKQNRKTKEIL